MHQEVSGLVLALEEAASLLRKHSIVGWADWLEKDIQALRNSDFYGIEHLLSAYGGMGSLNDIGLYVPEPEKPGSFCAHSDDLRLQELIQEVHSLAHKLSREEHGLG